MTSSKEPSPTLARALVRSLTRGTAVSEGARFINVGQDHWLAAQQELLSEVAEDGHAETKFVRGAYGSGKSHFLAVVQDHARDHHWVTAHVECKVDRVEIDRFETLYPRIANKMLMKDLIEARAGDPSSADLDAMRFLLERWTNRKLYKIGVREDSISRPFDAEHRLHTLFHKTLLKSTQSPGFVQALIAFSRATLMRDHDLTTSVCSWMRGSNDMLRIPARYLRHPNATDETKLATVQIRPIGAGTAHDAMRGLLWLIRDAGYAGLILCIDEVEELARLRTQTRQDQALQALREFVDHGGGEGSFRYLCMYLAATPEMFESERYFPRYDALATRIQPLSDAINWRGPVVDLEKTPLDAKQMSQIANRIQRVFRVAYGPHADGERLADLIEPLVAAVMATRYRIAKPRLLARMLIDELERARAQASAYEIPHDMASAVSQAAAIIAAERDAP